MDLAAFVDPEGISRVCRRHGVARLRVFGSVVRGRFDPGRSDVEFLPEVHDLVGHYLALKSELEELLGRKVDLVMPDAVENPYFAAQAFGMAEDVYAA